MFAIYWNFPPTKTIWGEWGGSQTSFILASCKGLSVVFIFQLCRNSCKHKFMHNWSSLYKVRAGSACTQWRGKPCIKLNEWSGEFNVTASITKHSGSALTPYGEKVTPLKLPEQTWWELPIVKSVHLFLLSVYFNPLLINMKACPILWMVTALITLTEALTKL